MTWPEYSKMLGDASWAAERTASEPKSETTSSLDGRTKTIRYDYDGDGIFEVAMQSVRRIDGSVTDVDYLFTQVRIDQHFVDTSPNCGNICWRHDPPLVAMNA
jgi:hypothetical protein